MTLNSIQSLPHSFIHSFDLSKIHSSIHSLVHSFMILILRKMASAYIPDCLFPDYETKEHFHPLDIRRSDGTSVIPDDLPALETTLSTIFDGVLTVEIGVRTGTRGRRAIAWFLNDETVKDALMIGGVMCCDIYFNFEKE